MEVGSLWLETRHILKLRVSTHHFRERKSTDVISDSLDRGQGLNHCICDVANLVDAVKKTQGSTTPLEAVSAYDDELVQRGSKEVQISYQQAIMFHDWKQLMNSPMMTLSMNQA